LEIAATNPLLYVDDEEEMATATPTQTAASGAKKKETRQRRARKGRAGVVQSFEAPSSSELAVGGWGGGGGKSTRCERSFVAKPAGSEKKSESACLVGRLVLRFHHILAEDKREYIVESAMELGLSGWSRAGTPGCVLIEGEPESIGAFVARLRELKWQTMELAAYETAPTRAIEPISFEEVTSMSAVSRGATQYGLQDLLEAAKQGTGWVNATAAFGGVAKMEYHERRAMEERQRYASPTLELHPHSFALFSLLTLIMLARRQEK